MEMKGEYRIFASREIVWDALNDPEVLKACLEGCESLDKRSETEFDALVKTKVGPIKTTFSCSLELTEIDPPNTYILSGQGNGGASGYAKGSVKVVLAEDEGATVLGYTVDASLRGKIGQMGARVIDSVAKKMADEFFNRLRRIVNERTGVATETELPIKSRNTVIYRAALIAAAVGLVIFGIVILTD
ncbi:MAG: carbon monoxide dehydrogenase subunit G [Woeseiaceae bacterium]|jgi:carbon monoxide dehydrogenase subunit G